eukprot:TRINITY_DN11388_c1_g3_i1.p1 TRINITY_DN11388_c1_g3~~TRINITY_DN11388_c1_g3_i1.p1  ORF type:complete len:826 (-),score=173.28 TRINITY_DN11388_c1_g3_i1:196-2640(-)
MDTKSEGRRQLERAERLLDVGSSSAPRSKRASVHKSLEQLFGEARQRAQTFSSIGAGAFGAAAQAKLLQTPQAQRLERDVQTFSLTPAPGVVAGLAGKPTGAQGEVDDQPSVGLREFFGLRHERVILEAVEEAQRDCLRSCERHCFERIQSDWEDAKAQILGAASSQRLGAAPLALPSQSTAGGQILAAPPQDAQIIDALLAEPMSQALVQRIGQLSAQSCPAYQLELAECWNTLSHQLKATAGEVTRGALWYLQSRFAEEIKALVFKSSHVQLGGIPDAWSLVRAYGRIKFETPNFPSTSAHVWFAAYIAARAGLTSVLAELPDKASPTSERCPMLRAVCTLMAQRLQATLPRGQGPQDFPPSPQQVDPADLLKADLAEESNGFHDVLVSLLLGRSFAFGRLPEATVEDWIWYRLHSVHLTAKDDEHSTEFQRQLEALRQQAASLPPSHFDPATPAAGSIASSRADGSLAAMTGTGRTLNFVKVLLLTAQFGRAIQQLPLQDRCLQGAALHMALVLNRAGTLEACSGTEQSLNVSSLLCDYAANFGCREQLQYLRALDLGERVKALQRLLLQGGAAASDELLGFIDGNGRHRPGLLERTLQEDGMGDQAEFVDLCARAGRQAAQQGQYREAVRLLHLGRCYSDVLQVLSRCLRLPIWREEVTSTGVSADEAGLLAKDIQRFFAIYERNLDRYALSSQAWAVARKLYGARMFHALCDRGQPEAALDLFDREQLLPLAAELPTSEEASDDVLAEYPRIISDYVRILRHAAAQGTVVTLALQERVRQLQSFLASRCSRLDLDQDTNASLAQLALCC